MISMTLILPAQYQADGNALAVALGHDTPPSNTYSVPLSATGAEPATHYGCRPDVMPGFALLVSLAKGATPPDGTSPELIAMAAQMTAQWPDAMAALIADARETDDKFGHWSDVLTANGLQRIEEII